MALLNFKMGLYKDPSSGALILDNVAKKAGTVYITTDERAMYVDTDDNNRIRIGRDLIIYDSVGDPKIEPPFSTDALYYFEKEKALMKYTGTEWIQLNSTKEVMETLSADIEAAQSAADAAQATANAAQTTANAAQTAADNANANANSRVLTSDFEDFKTSNTAAIAAAKTAADQGVADAATAAGAAAEAKNAANAAQAAADLKAPINHASEANTYGLGDSTNYGHVKLSDAVTSDSGVTSGVAATPAAVKIAKEAADAAKAAADVAQEAANKNAGDIAAQGEKIAALEDGTYDDTEIRGLITAEAERAQGKESELEGEISNVSNKVDTLEGTVNSNKIAAEAAIDAVNDKIGVKTDTSSTDTVYGYINSKAESSNSTLNSVKTELQTAINLKADKTALDELAGQVNNKAEKTELTALETKLTDNIEEKINAANAMTYKGIISPSIAEEDDTHFKTLPTTNVSVGDTYVAAEDLTGTVEARIGDLIIANGEENGGQYIESSLTWQVVPTGYSSTTDPNLVVKNDNTVTLQNAAAQSLGKVTFAAATDSSLKVTTENNTITYSIEWGTF